MKPVRSEERFCLLVRPTVVEPTTQNVIGHCTDLSYGGFCMVTVGVPGTYPDHRIGLVLPFDGLQLELDTQVIWTKPDARRELHLVGYRFLFPTEEDHLLLKKMISRMDLID